MAGENEAVTLLRYRTDNASVQAAVQANKNVAASYKDLQTAAANFSPDTLKLNPQLLATQTAITSELQRQLPLADRLAEAARVRAAAEQGTIAGLRGDAFGGGLTGGATARGGRSLGQNVTKAGRDLFNLPDVGGSTTISRLLILGGAGIDKFGLSVRDIGQRAAIAAPLLIGVALAFEAFNQQTKENKRLLEGALTAQKNFYSALGELTTDQVKAQIEELQAARPLLEQQLAETRNSIISAFGEETLTDQFGAGRFNRGLAKLLAPDLFTSLDEQTDALEENIQTEERLTAGIKDNSFAANDAAEAERLLAETRAAATAEILKAQNDYAESFVRGQTLTTAEREKEIESLEQQIASYEELIASGTQSGDQIRALNDNIGDLQNQMAGLQDATSEYADQLERVEQAQQALTERNDAYLDLIDQEIAAHKEAFAIQEKILAIEAERDQRIREIEADRDERLLELTGDAEERRIEIIEDAADRIAKIERDAYRDRANAIGNRDALAFTQAEQRRKDALDDQQTALDKSLKQVVKNLDKQEKALEKSYRKQVDNVIDSSNKQLQVQYNALTQANFLIQSALQAQNAHVQSGFQLMVGGTAQGMLLMQNIVVTGFMNMVNAVQGIFGGGGSQFPPVGGGGVGGGGIGGFGARRYIENVVTDKMYNLFRSANPVGVRL